MRTVSVIMTGFLLLAATGTAQTGGEALRGPLEQVYQQWRKSVVGKNYGLWQQTTARARQIAVRNRIHSERRPFPAAVFEVPVAPPSLRGLKALRVEARGAVAKAVYFGKIDFEVSATPTDNLLVVNYANEGGRWKYDGAEFVNLSALPEVRKKLQAGDYSYVKSAEFGPAAKPASLPFELKGPVKYIAKTYVYAPGRDVQVMVNKISRHRFQNTKAAEVIIGGARDGRNEVQYAVKKLPGATGKEPLAIRVYLMSEVQGVQPIKIFEYQVPENGVVQKPAGTHYFNVTPEVVRKLQGG